MFHQRFLMFHPRFFTSHISKTDLYLDVFHGLWQVFLLKWSECLCFMVFVSKIIVQRFLMHARFFGAYVLTFQPDFRAN